MNRELTDRLVTAFPRLYRGRSEPMTTNLMGFGFECGDGWFDLIHWLSGEITRVAEGEGRTESEWPKAIQVKEKFGELRFYADGLSPAMAEAVDRAEEASLGTCELCGGGGRLRREAGWMTTLCAYHASTTYRVTSRAARALERLGRLLGSSGVGSPARAREEVRLGDELRWVLDPEVLAFFDTRSPDDALGLEFRDRVRQLGLPDLDNWLVPNRSSLDYRETVEALTREAREGYEP